MQRRVLAEEVKPPSTTDHINDRYALPTKITPSAAKPPFFAPIIKRPTARERFPISPRSQLFRKRFFPEASAPDWNDWRWQTRSRVKNLTGLERIFDLSDDEAAAIGRHTGSLPVGITPYYVSLFDRDDRDRAAAPHPYPGRRRISAPARRGGRPARRRPRRRRARPRAPLSRPRAVPGDRLLLDLLPLLHALAPGRRGRRRIPVQRAPVGARDRLYRGAHRDPRRADLGRRSR